MIIKIHQEGELPSIPAHMVEDFLPFEEAVAERIMFSDRKISSVEKQGAKFDLKVAWGSAHDIENTLIMLWIPERKEWVAIRYHKWLESGARYDEDYSGPYALNEYAQRKLQQAFGIPKDMNISPSDTTFLPPEILTALGTKSS
jgi:hypothetical protein